MDEVYTSSSCTEKHACGPLHVREPRLVVPRFYTFVGMTEGGISTMVGDRVMLRASINLLIGAH